MALRKTGSRLVLEGVSTYVTGMRTATQSNQGFGESVNKSSDAMDKGTVKAVAFGNVIGNFITKAISKGAQVLGSLASEAVSAYGEYERLSQSMTSLVAKELRSKDATLDMATATEQASEKAQQLLGWIQELAIKSPFDQQGVAMAFRTALSYGFASDEAQRLTAATIDFATATGATGPVMDQLARALGQIKANGRLMGGELLQLVGAGINVQEMLKEMGYTQDDVSAGLVSADEFMKHFVETMENDFGGAAEESANTLTGLINSLGDLRQMGLRELFGPAFEAALPTLSALVGKFQEMLPVVGLVGQYLGRITTFVIENRNAIMKGIAVLGAFVGGIYLVANAGTILTAVVTALTAVVSALGAVIGFILSPIGLVAIAIGGLAALFVASFGKIQEKTGGFFNGMSSDLFDYGSNLIMMLAEGMAAAMTAVIQVLNAIGKMISNWLAPGSPPKLLPDIDKWGTAAMQEYIGGMSNADFGAFQSISNKLESYMKSIGGDDPGLNKRILAMRQAVMEAVNSTGGGGMSDNAFQNIFAAMKIANPALQAYAREVINVQVAQQKLNEITKKYSEIIGGHQAELDAIANRRQQIIDEQRTTELETIKARAEANGDMLAVELAEMELREIALKQQIALAQEQEAAEKDAAQAQLDSAQDRLDLQGALIDEQIKNNQLLQDQKDSIDAAVGAGPAGGAGAMPGEGAGLGGLENIPSATDDIDGALEQLKGRFEQFVKDLAEPFQGIKDELSTLTDTWSTTFIDIGNAMAPFVEKLRVAWGEGGTWSGIMDMATQIIRTQWGEGGTWSGIMDLLKITVDLLQNKWLSIFGVNGSWSIMMRKATLYFNQQFGENGVWSGIMENIKTAVDLMQLKFEEKLKLIGDKFAEVADFVLIFKRRLNELKTWIENNVLRVNIDIPPIPDWMLPGSPIKLHTALKDFKSFLNTSTFRPKFDIPQAQPVTAAGIGGGNVITNNYYNQQQVQGIGAVSARNGIDLAMIQAVVDQAIQTALRS